MKLGWPIRRSSVASDAPLDARGSEAPATPRERLAIAVLVLLAPVVAITTTPLRIRTGGLDPMTYLGYLNDYEALAARFGQTYHGNRLSYVLVDRTAMALLGFEWGYFAVRYGMLVLAGAAIAALGRRLGGTPLAALGVVALVLVPWLSRQLLWTHYDGIAAIYLLVAAVLLLVPVRRRGLAEFGAGVFVALAINANVVLVALTGVAVVAWIVGRRHDVLRDVLASGARVLAGMAATFSLLSLRIALWYPQGPYFSETVAIRKAFELSGDTDDLRPMAEWIGRQRVLWIVPLLALLLVVEVVRTARAGRGVRAPSGPASAPTGEVPDVRDRQRVAIESITVWLVLTMLLYLFVHFRAQQPWMQLSYYRIHLLPSVTAGVLALAALARQRAPDTVDRAVWAATGLLVVVWFVGGGPSGALLVPGLVVMGGLATATIVVARRPPAAAAVAFLAPMLLLMVWASPGTSLERDSLFGTAEREALEWDTARVGIAMQDLIESEVPRDRAVKFWHAAEGDSAGLFSALNAVYYGDGGQRLHRRPGQGYAGMPDLEEGNVLELIRSAQPLTAVLLGDTREEVGNGLATLVQAGLPARAGRYEVIEGDVLTVHVLLVDID